MRLEDSLLMTMSCADVSYDSLMACDEPWIGGMLLGHNACLTASEINRENYSTPNKSGGAIATSAWLIDSVWVISRCENVMLLNLALTKAFDAPAAYNALRRSDDTNSIQQRSSPFLASHDGTISSLFAIRDKSADDRSRPAEFYHDFYRYLKAEQAKIKVIRDRLIESVMNELEITFTALL